MIKITHSLSVNDKEKFMSNIVDDHWTSLNKKKESKSSSPKPYNNHSLVYKIETLISEYESGTHLNDIANKNKAINDIHIDFLKYLTSDNYSNLKTCIKGNPTELEILSNDIFSKFGFEIFEEQKKRGGIVGSKFSHLLLKRVFNYKSFRSSDKCIELYKKLDLEGKYCPYCNSNQFEIISKEVPTKNKHVSQNGLLLFDLDHFFLKYKHPFLALAFYNLIPCCPSCNSRVRGDIDFSLNTHINPYDESFHEHFEFSLDKKSVLLSTMTKKLSKFDLRIDQRPSSTRSEDITCVDLKILHRLDSQIYKGDVENIANTFLKYHNKKNENFVDTLHGINGQHVPLASKDISNVQRGKLKLDIVNIYREGSSLPLIT
ncbi:hypothetical protein CA159_24670 [Vibrio parahaemolyticus]|nr:hypothetical protein BBL86_02035 [Vibrio parahaemolyticus]OXD16338.1 hypothetical protein CA159_24670 [Vibrio parahaemolyticus]TPB14136.1 hypothetical protein DXJ83_12515 [Vibrio parahaemolyticus]